MSTVKPRRFTEEWYKQEMEEFDKKITDAKKKYRLFQLTDMKEFKRRVLKEVYGDRVDLKNISGSLSRKLEEL